MHSHAGIDHSIVSSDRGLWAVKWSFVGLFITAVDAATAIPLAIAFACQAEAEPSLYVRLRPHRGLRRHPRRENSVARQRRARGEGSACTLARPSAARAEVNITVGASLTVEQGHEIATDAHRQMMAHLPFLARAVLRCPMRRWQSLRSGLRCRGG